MVSRFFIYLGCIGFALGIFIRCFFDPKIPEVLLLLLISTAVCIHIWRKRDTVSFAPYVYGVGIFLFLFVCGILKMDYALQNELVPELESQLGTTVSMQGVVVREPDVRVSTQQLYVETSDDLLLVIADRYQDISYGDKVSFTGKLKKPEAFETDLGRVFEYGGYLQARGVTYMVSFAKVEVISSDNGNSIISTLLAFKESFITKIEASITEPYVGLGKGLLLGVKSALGEDIETAFRKAGITHIVVLSGYNIMLVVAFILFVLSFCLPLRGRLLFGAIAIVLFACMVGLSATVVRASAMAILVLVAKATGRTYTVLRALFLTATVMLLFNPYLLVYDVGFQLSFIATLGLIVLSPSLETYVRFMPKTIGLREFLTATLATQIFVLPILLYQIGEFSLIAVFVNVLVLPMVPIAMMLTFVTGIAGFVSVQLSVVLGYLAYLSLAYILYIAEVASKLPFATITVPEFPFSAVIISYCILAFVVWRLLRTESYPEDELTKNWLIVDEETFTKEALTSKVM